jgi:hypothetical protein
MNHTEKENVKEGTNTTITTWSIGRRGKLVLAHTSTVILGSEPCGAGVMTIYFSHDSRVVQHSSHSKVMSYASLIRRGHHRRRKIKEGHTYTRTQQDDLISHLYLVKIRKLGQKRQFKTRGADLQALDKGTESISELMPLLL